ncbi:CPBP family intramembrane glutamic endopeptidase [Phenylobacterium sp.]|jgi:membrane protease YdiL (CAAX protease family)|uniref:CPBP family intramembrane glutamic endopeptidase n=1 Tax=Phenylobacterium sp. TaxID=1871053 RepID=UPI002F41CA7B
MTRPVALPIAAFLVVSAIASPLLAKAQDLTGLDPNILRLTVFSTAVGVVVVWAIWRKGLPHPAVTTSRFDKALALAVAAGLAGVAIALALAKIEHAPWGPPNASALGAPLGVVLAVQVLGAAAEEVGWRGLVQPLLETRLAAWISALVTGALFGLGHFYLAFAVPPAAFALFLVSALGMSMILALATVGRSLGARIAIATLLHFLLNMATLFLFSDGDGSVRYFAGLALAFGLSGAFAAIVLARDRRAPSGSAALQGADVAS